MSNEEERASQPAQLGAGPARLSRRGLLGGVAAGVVGGALPVLAGPAVAAGPAAAVHSAADAAAAPELRTLATDLDWSRFLAEQDLIWGRIPDAWYEGPFLGNGYLGTMVYREPPPANALRFTVQHSEVQDHRPEFGSGYGLARLPVGHLTLEPQGTIIGVGLRLDLWNAELRGTVVTDRGELSIRAAVHSDRSVLVATVTPTEGERDFRWVFHPEEAISPRLATSGDPPAGYTGNPPPELSSEDGVQLVVQPLLAGGQTATAYREVTRAGSSPERTLYLHVAHTFPGATAAEQALAAIRGAAKIPPDGILATHRAWWHRFYRKSFLSIPDQRLQSFFWIQLYKVASATRAGAPVMATCGPWLEPTPWPAVWWNLNVQLEYWLIYGSNHLELDSITSTLSASRQQLIDNVPSAYREDSAGVGRSSDMFCVRSVPTPGSSGTPEVGDLTWALHNVWLSYRHSMDEAMLRDTLFPLLRRAINYYRHFLYTGSDGRLHLPLTQSPEYGNAPDCNYDLALIRWGCRTLLDSARTLGIDDPLAPSWQEVLDTLVDYPVDDTGFMIGAGVPYAMSHRHYSHLLMIYPLYLVNWEQPEHRELIEKSIARWHALTGAHRGYSYTGAASMYATMGRGDTALAYLNRFFDPSTAYPCLPNTMYTEAGPVIETPLSAAQSIHDMLVQSWGGAIRVFPGVPAAWRDLTVHDFRTEGAFLVSAVRRDGSTDWVRVASLAGEPCRLRPGIDGPLTVKAIQGRDPQWRDLGGGTVEIDLPRGGEVVVYRQGTAPDLTIRPVQPATPGEAWGLPLALATPGSVLAWPGEATQVTVTFYNHRPAEVTDVQIRLTAPAGWTVEPAPASPPGTVPANGIVTMRWQILAPVGTPGGTHELSVEATFRDEEGSQREQAAIAAAVPYGRLSDAFDNKGISDNGNTGAASIDGAGSSLSAQALAAAGVTPGGPVSHGGVEFTWPDVPPGQPDNVAASGEGFELSGQGSTLGFLATSSYGATTGIGAVVYTDGSTQPFTISVPDWYQAAPAGSDPAIVMPYRNRPNNTQQQRPSGINVFFVGVPLQDGKTVRGVVLPNVSAGVVSGQPALHVFAVGIG
jgi:alpha-L-fucosidase 2